MESPRACVTPSYGHRRIARLGGAVSSTCSGSGLPARRERQFGKSRSPFQVPTTTRGENRVGTCVRKPKWLALLRLSVDEPRRHTRDARRKTRETVTRRRLLTGLLRAQRWLERVA